MLAHTGKNIRLNVPCFGAFWVATVQLAVNAYIIPDGAMAHELLLDTDSWARFPVREYKDIGEHETILTLRTTQHVGVHPYDSVYRMRFSKWYRTQNSFRQRTRQRWCG